MKIRRLVELMGICYTLIRVVVIEMHAFVKTHQLRMDIEGIMLNEIGQKEKEKYYMISLISRI